MKKYTPEEKLEIINKVLIKQQTISSVAMMYGLTHTTLSSWIRNYESMGAEIFYKTGWTNRSPVQKEAAVLDYLNGQGSLRAICRMHKISDTKTLRQWIMKYNDHEVLKSSGAGGNTIMTKGRTTTFDERVEIVQYCLTHKHNYAETAEKYQISYQQARSYTLKYEANGVDALKDNRGRRKSENEMTEVERLRAENRLLKAENKHAEMEISFLKKLEEIERGRG